MSAPRLCVVFEAIGPYNAIGKIATAEVEAALSAGWRVSVVAHRLAEHLRDRVEWRKLYNPPRGFAVKWLTARHFIGKAIGDRAQFDVIHGHQPQIADWCDVFECHFLTRAALERGCLDARPGLRGALARAQERVVLRAEDRCYRRWNPATELVCGSGLMERAFDRLYGLPPRRDVQPCPAPRWNPATPEERAAARRELVGDWPGPVVGFLGGMDERKGFRAALDATAEAEGVFLLLGGSHGEQVVAPPKLRPRFRGMGLVGDVDRFYAAVDVLLVPSVFEPFGLVCLEAAARGVPVIATETVGALGLLESAGCGLRWAPGQPLVPLMQGLMAGRERTRKFCRALVEGHGQAAFAARLLERYEAVLSWKTGGAAAAPEAASV